MQVDLDALLRSEYNELLDKWSQDLYWRTVDFLRTYAKSGWIRRFDKKTLAACLVLTKFNLPITAPLVCYLTGKSSTVGSSNTLKTLASYGLLLANKVQHGNVRVYRLSPEYIEKWGDYLAENRGGDTDKE